MEVRRGSFTPATNSLRGACTNPWAAPHVQPSRRPNRMAIWCKTRTALQHYYAVFQGADQTQPAHLQELYLGSLEAIGSNMGGCMTSALSKMTWESPTLGAWGSGLGSLVRWYGSVAVHYFQQVGGARLHPVNREKLT